MVISLERLGGLELVGKFVSLRIVELKVMEVERGLESDGGGSESYWLGWSF
jgi:hypothetical protein